MHREQKPNSRTLIIVASLFLLALMGDIILFAKSKAANSERDRAVLKSDSILSSALNMEKRNDFLKNDLITCNNRLKESETFVKRLKEEIKENKLVRTKTISSIEAKRVKNK